MIVLNDEKTSGIMTTKNGPVTFTLNDNEVHMRVNKTSHRLEGHDLDDVTFEYMYNSENNAAFA